MPDLHLANLVVFDKDTNAQPPFSPVLVDPRDQRTINAMFTEKARLPLHLPPKQRALLSSKETVTVPKDIMGFVTLRSTFARLGLISPPTVADPGFTGTITFEVYNSSNHKILIQPGEAVFSITMVQLMEGSEDSYSGRYQGQNSLTLPKALLEMPEVEETIEPKTEPRKSGQATDGSGDMESS